MKVNTGCSFLHPITGQMIHPGQTYEDNPTQFVNPPQKIEEKHEGDQEADVAAQLTLEEFMKLGADEQKHKLVELEIVSDDDDEAVSNKEKRAALYQKFLGGGVGDGKGTSADQTSPE
ncbi:MULTISPECIES: hypothetical protein [Brevibacillus]|uniref:hypothetical protein n=1 Tax=Brevibacillus TaxID=55080 RepID=UPI0004F34447|nr:hypothetical protein [Brevibacillus borstelensis]KKX52570.1 hypothetical protein X546_24485 [Brevibacillus borstelensis cifa_chp40]